MTINKLDTIIKIEIYDDGFCQIKYSDKDTTEYTSARTPLQALMTIFAKEITDEKFIKNIDDWTGRIHKEHAEIIDELAYNKIKEVAEFATDIKKSLYN